MATFAGRRCVIAVKAYGGRRYTSAKRLILERAQKTRGKFYLFGVYEVNTGRRRWAFYNHKTSEQVCHFMKQIRRWYPEQSVWIALDRDSTHPCKSGQTRRVMRQLKLHWITLPTGSPDDNPVETFFSDIQLMILDTSNDPDAKTRSSVSVVIFRTAIDDTTGVFVSPTYSILTKNR